MLVEGGASDADSDGHCAMAQWHNGHPSLHSAVRRPIASEVLAEQVWPKLAISNIEQVSF